MEKDKRYLCKATEEEEKNVTKSAKKKQQQKGKSRKKKEIKVDMQLPLLCNSSKVGGCPRFTPFLE